MTEDLVQAQLLAIADTRKLLRQFEDKLMAVTKERNDLRFELEKSFMSCARLAADNAMLLNALKIAKRIFEDRLSQTDDMRPIYEAIELGTK